MALFSFGGSASTSTTNESGSSRANTSGSETSKQVTQRLSDSQISDLGNVLKLMQESLTGKSEFTREAAIQDSEGIIKDLFKQYSQSVLPQIISKASQSGAYNSTSAQLLADNAFAETLGKAATVRTNAIAQYSQAADSKKQVATQAVGTILQSLLQARESTDLTTLLNSVTDSTYKGTSKTKGAQVGFQFAGGK